MVSAICPRPLSHHLERAARRAAERAQGLPGRFVRLLWPQAAGRTGRTAPRRGAAAPCRRAARGLRPRGRDRRPVGGAGPSLCVARPRRTGRASPTAGCRGRASHARQARAGPPSTSSGDWRTRAAQRLGPCGRRRAGARRPAPATRTGARARWPRSTKAASMPGDPAATVCCWTWRRSTARPGSTSRGWTKPRASLATALATARAARDPARVAAASVTLARCLYWRGQYPEAEAALGSRPDDVAAVRVRHALLAARVAVGLRDVNRAMSLVLTAGEWASADGSAASRAAVSFTAALVHLAVGDLDAVERDVSESIAAARAAHDPLRAIRARLLRAEAERRRGRHAAAVAQLQRLRRVMATMPPALRARWDLCSALAREMAIRRQLVAQRVAATGLGALGLYASDPRVVSGIVPLDRCLRRRARRNPARLPGGGGRGSRAEGRLRCASGSTCGRRRSPSRRWTGNAPRSSAATASGSTRAIAERAADLGLTIAPHRRDDRIEAAAPVQDRRPADRRPLRTLDAWNDRRHLPRGLGADDERRRSGADAGGDNRAAAAGGRGRRERAAGRDAGHGRAQEQRRARGGGPFAVLIDGAIRR